MDITGKIIVDFQVYDNENPKVIIIDDSSTWKHIENKPSIIEITLPGEETPIITTFAKLKRNIFTSNLLGISCINECEDPDYLDLPDGVYKVTLKGSPDSFNKTRSFLKTSLLELEMKKLFVTSNFECNNISGDFINFKLEFDLFLKAAKANITFNNTKKAFYLYGKAEELLERMKNCKKCKDNK